MICNNKSIRDGTNQLERQSRFLKEGYVLIDERSQLDLLDFMYRFSIELTYYDLNNQIIGDWQSILEGISDIKDLTTLENQDIPPHIGLLIVLTELYTYVQNEINTITQKHLDYYYEEVLKILPKKAIPDQVQLVLDLAKSNSFDEFLLKKNTAFNAGKDIDGNSLIYEADKESVISRAQIQSIKTIYLDEVKNNTVIRVAPFANSKDGIGEPLDESISFWPSFGESQNKLAIEKRTMTDASIGFAISSFTFLLKEGERDITLDINLSPDSDFSNINSLNNSFTIYYSGEKGWEEPISYVADISLLERRLKLEIKINNDQPAFTFYNSEIHEESYPTQSPLLKIFLKPGSPGYDALKDLKVDSVDINVAVSGLKNNILQSDIGVLNPESPFLPFGPQPLVNSSFYIGNAEIFRKRLSSLTIELLWHDIPDAQFVNHYSQYGISDDFGNNSFISDISLLLNKSWDNLLKVREPLFNLDDANLPRIIEVEAAQFNVNIAYEDAPSVEDLEPYTTQAERGFIKIELLDLRNVEPFKAFGHKEFPQLYTEQAIALATYDPIEPGNPPQPVLPNQPYTPTIKELTLGYTANKTIVTNAQSEYDNLFQIGPFGFRQLDAQFHRELVPIFEEEGSLIIGLDNFSPPQTLNLLFDIEEGTAKRSVILPPENISWNYLSQETWIPLSPQEILTDGTSGFKQSGIVSLVIPRNATNTDSFLSGNLFWIKATISEAAEGANKLKNIYSNAVNATLKIEDENYDAHLNEPLPAESISNLLNRVKEIKKVEQPLKSVDGFPNEPTPSYTARVAERLRHKNRSIQLWDYERMILEAFPNIYKVKCLAHTDSNSTTEAGSVTLIVVSNLRNKDTINPFEPNTSQLTLDEIKSFVELYISPFVKVNIELPIYESILVDAKIGFNSGFDPGFYSNLLNEELKQFLSPWAFVDGVDIEIGGAIYKSSILQFIESKNYVDYVVDFELYHKHLGGSEPGLGELIIEENFEISPDIILGIQDMTINSNFIIGSDVNVACATSPRSILVSALDHRIQPLRPDEYQCSGASSLGIGFMTIDVDFIINDENSSN
ncbi:baseplate J/gp47 family protein [Aquimarina algiphila]|uniref:baseplate J/gp47 family protein n=1 Tax=Aquimarina algiphila TaxID=2047982 RepID=UPI00249326A3|nr:baseplate J/gp47 family protein [Aquimarina algiphila]